MEQNVPRLSPVQRLADDLAAALGEAEYGPRVRLRQIALLIGAERAWAWVEEAKAIYAGPGMLTKDGSRKRTLGGCFFALARDGMTQEERARIWPRKLKQPKPKQPPKPEQPPKPAPAPVVPANLEEIVEAANALEASERGVIMSVTIKLTGRPGKLQEQGACVYFVLVAPTVPPLAKGMPTVAPGTRHLVCVSKKQWEKVAPLLAANPEDGVLVEGYPITHPQFQGITVMATTCLALSTKKAQRVARPKGATGNEEQAD